MLVLSDLLWWAAGLPGAVVGVVEFHPADVIALLCLAFRRTWFCSLRWGSREVCCILILGIIGAAGMHGWGAGPVTVLAVAVASALEEVIFRFCWTHLLSVLLGAVWECSRRPFAQTQISPPIVLSAAVFAARPGHLHQFGSLWGAIPFAAFALLMSMVMRRSGSLVVPMALHITLNMTAFATLRGPWPHWLYVVALALAVAVALVPGS